MFQLIEVRFASWACSEYVKQTFDTMEEALTEEQKLYDEYDLAPNKDTNDTKYSWYVKKVEENV